MLLCCCQVWCWCCCCRTSDCCLLVLKCCVGTQGHGSRYPARISTSTVFVSTVTSRFDRRFVWSSFAGSTSQRQVGSQTRVGSSLCLLLLPAFANCRTLICDPVARDGRDVICKRAVRLRLSPSSSRCGLQKGRRKEGERKHWLTVSLSLARGTHSLACDPAVCGGFLAKTQTKQNDNTKTRRSEYPLVLEEA